MNLTLRRLADNKNYVFIKYGFFDIDLWEIKIKKKPMIHILHQGHVNTARNTDHTM